MPVETSLDYSELGSLYYVVHKDRICFFCTGGSVSKEFARNSGDTAEVDSVPESGRPSGGERGNSLQYSCLENPVVRGAWRATVRRVAKSWT